MTQEVPRPGIRLTPSEHKRLRAFEDLLRAASEYLSCFDVMPRAEDEKRVLALGRRVGELAHAFVEADTAQIISESTFIAAPDRTQ